MALTAPLHHQDFLKVHNMSSSPGDILSHRRRTSSSSQKFHPRRFQCDKEPASRRTISPAVSLLLQITEIPTLRHQRRRNTQRKNGSSLTKCTKTSSNEIYHFPQSEDQSLGNLLFDDCFGDDGKCDPKNRSYFDLLLSSPEAVVDDEIPGSEFSSDTLSPLSVHSPIDTDDRKSGPSHIDYIHPRIDSSWTDGSEKSMTFSQDLHVPRLRPSVARKSSSSSSLSSPTDRTKKSLVRAEPAGSHPLDDSDASDTANEFQIPQKKVSQGVRRRSSLVSNLTRSLRSFSRAAVSSIASQNKMLTGTCNNSLYVGLSPRLTDERRPQGGYVPHSLDLTTKEQQPASQKVVNPRRSLVRMAGSSLATPSFNDEEHVSNEMDEQLHSVELKTYKLDHIFKKPLRYRDVRMNSDFLRLLAIETCMRKVGKLSDVIPGKARMAIPPRQGDLTVTYRPSPLHHAHSS